jgi:hypothetical protein
MQEKLLYSFWKLLLSRGIIEDKRGYELFGIGLIGMSRVVARYLDGKTEKQMFQWKINELVVTSPMWDDFRSQLIALNNAIKCVIVSLEHRTLTDETINIDAFREISRIIWNYTNNNESLPCFLDDLLQLAYEHETVLPYVRIVSIVAMQNSKGE